MYLFTHSEGWSKTQDYPFTKTTEDLSDPLRDA